MALGRFGYCPSSTWDGRESWEDCVSTCTLAILASNIVLTSRLQVTVTGSKRKEHKRDVDEQKSSIARLGSESGLGKYRRFHEQAGILVLGYQDGQVYSYIFRQDRCRLRHLQANFLLGGMADTQVKDGAVSQESGKLLASCRWTAY